MASSRAPPPRRQRKRGGNTQAEKRGAFLCSYSARLADAVPKTRAAQGGKDRSRSKALSRSTPGSPPGTAGALWDNPT